MSRNSFSEKKWKYVSVGLMAILALGFSFPQAFAQSSQAILTIVQDIQAKVNSGVFGLQAIKTAVDTKASQASVNTLQTTANGIKAKTDGMLELREFHETAGGITTSNPFVFALFCDDTYVVHSVSYSTSIDGSSADDWNAPQFKRGGHSLNLHGLNIADAPAGTAPFEVVPINAGLDEFGTGVFEVTLSKSVDAGNPDVASVAVVLTVASDASCELA